MKDHLIDQWFKLQKGKTNPKIAEELSERVPSKRNLQRISNYRNWRIPSNRVPTEDDLNIFRYDVAIALYGKREGKKLLDLYNLPLAKQIKKLNATYEPSQLSKVIKILEFLKGDIPQNDT